MLIFHLPYYFTNVCVISLSNATISKDHSEIVSFPPAGKQLLFQLMQRGFWPVFLAASKYSRPSRGFPNHSSFLFAYLFICLSVVLLQDSLRFHWNVISSRYDAPTPHTHINHGTELNVYVCLCLETGTGTWHVDPLD